MNSHLHAFLWLHCRSQIIGITSAKVVLRIASLDRHAATHALFLTLPDDHKSLRLVTLHLQNGLNSLLDLFFHLFLLLLRDEAPLVSRVLQVLDKTGRLLDLLKSLIEVFLELRELLLALSELLSELCIDQNLLVQIVF